MAARARTRVTRLPAQRRRTKAAPGAERDSRERDVLRVLVAGLGTAAAAGALFVLPGNVRNRVHSIMAKLDARSTPHSVAISLDNTVLGTS